MKSGSKSVGTEQLEEEAKVEREREREREREKERELCIYVVLSLCLLRIGVWNLVGMRCIGLEGSWRKRKPDQGVADYSYLDVRLTHG